MYSSGKEVFLASALEVLQEPDYGTTTMMPKERSLAHFFFLQM